jgi:predicted nuclease of predicted toxin-antitoxin system
MRFLADESCDFAAVHALRAAGHDVAAVSDVARGAEDTVVIELARSERRVLLTEDKDFGQLVFAAARQSSGVVLLRWPVSARSSLGVALVEFAASHGDSLTGAFAVVEPGRARVSRSP